MKTIIFRDDDIAPFSQLDTLRAVNQVHIDKNVPVTLGIIAHPDPGFSGNELLADANTLSYLQSLATNPLFELAQHGYTHSDSTQNAVGTNTPRMVGTSPYADRLVGAGESSEFRGRSYTEQYNIIKQGRDDISAAFGVTPTTFIPPWNTGDTNTLKACTSLGFRLYSTNEADFGVTDATIEGIRVQAASLEFAWTETDWNSYMSDLISKTDAALNAAPNGANIVVLYHFWAFRNSGGSIDPNRVAWLGQYIDHLRNRGDVQFATLSGQKPSSLAAPAVCAQDANSLDVFVRGGDGALWWKHWDGDTWSAWESLGGVLTSSPAATSRSSGTLDVCVRGSDGALWERSYTSSSGGWSAWSKIGGLLASGTGPTACAQNANSLDVFVQGTDNALWHKHYESGWSAWESLGGVLTSSPAATSQSTGIIDVFVRGSDGALWHKHYESGWSAWESLGGM